MKREKMVILLGVFVALVFFYLGLNEWLSSKTEKVQAPPVIVKPALPDKAVTEAVKPPTQPPKEGIKGNEQGLPREDKKDALAQKIKEEKVKEEKRKEEKTEKEKIEQKKDAPKVKEDKEAKTYTVQVGAFKEKERAIKVMEKAKSMGYQVTLVEEDKFYKVRLTVHTGNLQAELSKLRKTFGGAILKK
ncbi:MAG: SPOR domain-containing protein [Aquificaceae bacterium]|nr:SPOR domain-containing protein [Aquificaceae bacterium]